jgi:tRNA dimethylallyltransferase
VNAAVPPLLVIAGPTATGKTGLSITVARALAHEGITAEIISADSRQVYRGLDIGTAKATAADRNGVPHHGLDLVEPNEPFTLADFAAHARDALAGIATRGGIAILVGGTGLYLRAVGRGIDTDALPSDPALRASLEADLARDGLEPLVARLQAAAPRRAARTDLRNPRRVVRALEIAALEGDRDSPPPRGYGGPVAWIGLSLDPDTHREWIAKRARAQFDAGLIEEARSLRERFDPTLPAFSAIGYREAWAVIDGSMTVAGAIAEDTRRNIGFAKRQRTWFRSEPGIEWLDAADENGTRTAALAQARDLLPPSG